MEVGPNLLLSVRSICRLRVLDFGNYLAGRQHLFSSGLITVVLYGILALHLMPFRQRPNVSAGLLPRQE